MSEKVFNIYGEMTYNEISGNQSSLIIVPSSSAAKREYVAVKDVEAEEVKSSFFRYINPTGKTREQMEDIDNDIRNVAASNSKKMVDVLAYHQAMKNINVLYVSTRDLYDELVNRYGITFSYESLRRSRSENRVITDYRNTGLPKNR